ncbi:rhomboid-like protein [Saccharothrix sp. ST-888]|uniref:rhomboid-like protein n=1 Tax=Saccharothrix sp. ST-888 TaxID=1427391 RepID=UPI000699187C|nr:rhomboid-like protein [Saccharothrix sp. ST-888]
MPELGHGATGAAHGRGSGLLALTGLLDKVRRLVPTPRRNPFALSYLLVLLGTTLFSRFGDPALVRRLQEVSSTDGHNLLHRPVLALLLSGLWVAGPVWMPYLWAFAFTVAPLERRVGGLRAAVAFGAGHVLATLLSQLVVALSVAAGRLGPDALDSLDIGVSYGVLASLGALAGLLRPTGRILALAGAGGMIGHQILTDQDLVTGVGHPVALLVGISLWRWLRRGRGRPLRLRRLLPGRIAASEA